MIKAQTWLPGSHERITQGEVCLAHAGLPLPTRSSGSLAVGILSPRPLSPETPLNYLTESGFYNMPSAWKQKRETLCDNPSRFLSSTAPRQGNLSLSSPEHTEIHNFPQFMDLPCVLSHLILVSPTPVTVRWSTEAPWSPRLVTILHSSSPRTAETTSSHLFPLLKGSTHTHARARRRTHRCTPRACS